jgi:hypothetical protein
MSKKKILKDLSDGKITADEAEEQIDKLQKEVTLKVTQKGCIGIYGIRRLPISIYVDEFNKIKDKIDDGTFESFIEENKNSLK